MNKRSVDVRTIRRGYSPAQRMIVSFADGTSLFFAKVCPTAPTREWLRRVAGVLVLVAAQSTLPWAIRALDLPAVSTPTLYS